MESIVTWTNSALQRFHTHSCFSPLVEELKKILSTTDIAALHHGGATTQVMKQLTPDFKTNRWHSQQPLVPEFPSGMPSANYQIDFQKAFDAEGCDSRHLLSVEFCFDNRQAIGTNLLKAELASARFETSENRVALNALVVLSDRTKKAGQWDGSVGIAEEYLAALNTCYPQLESTPILFMTI